VSAALRGALAGAAVVLAALAIWGATSALGGSGEPAQAAASAQAVAAFEAHTGLRVERLAVTAGGGLLDLRLRVLDERAANAMAKHGHGGPPQILRPGDDTPLSEAMKGHGEHVAVPHQGQTMYQLLANPTGAVRTGDVVVLSLGGARLEGVGVQ
jgi:hypothetical protein